MRPTTSALVGVLFILVIANCADVSQYLNPGESVSTEETFTVDGSVYTLIYVNENPAMLLGSDGSLITDSTLITRVLMMHYSALYYPTDAELAALRSDFEVYEWSRNNGDTYGNMTVKLPGMNKSVGVEEEICRYSLYLNVFPCEEGSCLHSAMMLCDELGDAIGCDDPRDLEPTVREFSDANIGLTDSTNSIFALMDNMSNRNIYSNLMEIKSIMEGMDEYEADLEGTLFRLPKSGEKCPQCMGLCPRIIINESYLESAGEKIDAMLGETAMLGDYSTQGARMSEQTLARIATARANVQRAYYHSIYDPARESAQYAINESRDVLVVVSNSSLRADTDGAAALITKIDADLAAGNFSQINSSMDDLRAKAGRIRGAIPAQWAIYNNTEKAKSEASLSLFIIETSQLSEEQNAVAASLSARKKALDRAFVAGLTPERYIEITGEYNNITQTAEPIVQQAEQSTAYMSPFKAAGRRTNEGFENLVVALQPMDRTERDELSGYAPLVLSAVSFFSLASLLTFAFLFVFAGLSSRIKKRSVMFMGFVALAIGVILVGVVSAGMYFTLKSSSSDADFGEFRNSLSGADHVSVLIEREGVSSGALSDMRECAAKIKGELSSRDVQVYERTDGNCITSQNTTLGECYNSVEEPIITLKYTSVEEKPEFSVVFVDSAVFAGDEQYFRECEFAGMLAVGLDEPPEAAAQNESSDWVVE